MTVLDSDIVNIARVCHAANRELQLIQGDPAPSPEWVTAPEWQQTSAVDGVLQALSGISPRELHNAWCTSKEADGWVFGLVKDAEAKTHPCLVDYDQLDDGQKMKDLVFAAIVTAMTAVIG